MLADPVEPGVDRKFEWVELVNTSAVVVSTGGWAIGDADSVDTLPAVEVPPGGFVVVAAEGAVLPVNVLVVRVPDGAIGNGLNNAGDALRLLSPAGAIVDALSFGDNRGVFTSPPAAPQAGATLAARSGTDGSSERWAPTRQPSPGGPNVFPEPSPAPPSPTPNPQATSTSRDGTAPADTTREPPVTPDPSRTPVALPVRFEQKPGSPAPWVALGGLGGASVVLTLAALARGWQRSRGRWRRGG